MSILKELESLIDEGYKVKKECYHSDHEYGFYDYVKGESYVTWIHKARMFIKANVPDDEIYNEFYEKSSRANGFGEDVFEEMIGMLHALKGYDFTSQAKPQDLVSKESNKKIDKIFISHSSKDVDYVAHLVQLLNDIGLDKSPDSIFCSSLAGYGIPYGENIYDFLKAELKSNNIMVLFVLSNNYYQSAPCLNEMGASWITSKITNTVLTPNFDFKHIAGAIDPTKISFNMDDEKGLDIFKDKIIEIFELEERDYKIWQGDRKRFVENISQISKEESITMRATVKLERVNRYSGNGKNEIELQLRFINNTDKEIEFMYIDFELVDSNGEKFNVSAEEDMLEGFRLHSYENRVESLIFKNETDYNPRRNNRDLSKIEYDIQM